MYKSIVESVLTFHLSAWYEHLNCRLKNKLSRIVSMANKITGRPQNLLKQLYVERTKKEARVILADSFHPLFGQFEPLKSGRRYRVPLVLKNVFKRGLLSLMQLKSLIQQVFNQTVCKAWTVSYYPLLCNICNVINDCVFILLCMLLLILLCWWAKDNFPLRWTIKLYNTIQSSQRENK